MDRNQALDDLKTIRQIMGRTQKAVGGHGGWFLVIAGAMWLAGFTGDHFLPDEYAGWAWLAINGIGTLAMIGTGMRLARHGSIRSPMWKPIFSYWLVLAAFAILLALLFGINTGDRIGLLALLVAATGYVQMGTIFQSRSISTVGMLVAALTIGAFVLVPDYFALTMAFLGGGLLICSGLWMVRAGK